MIKNKLKISVPGFLAGGISVGIKKKDQKDLGLIYSTVPAQGRRRCLQKTPLRRRRF